MVTGEKVVLMTKEESEEKEEDEEDPKWCLIDIQHTKNALVWCLANLKIEYEGKNSASTFKIRTKKNSEE